MIRLFVVGVGAVLLFIILLLTSTGFGCHVQDKLSNRLGIEACTK